MSNHDNAVIVEVWIFFKKIHTSTTEGTYFYTPAPSTWNFKTAWVQITPPIHPDFHEIVRYHNFNLHIMQKILVGI